MDASTEPPTASSFLSRYRAAKSPPLETPALDPQPSLPVGDAVATPPPASPRPVPKAAKVWSSTFHPGGRSPRTAARFDSGKTLSGDGNSVSEMHDAGRADVDVVGKIVD